MKESNYYSGWLSFLTMVGVMIGYLYGRFYPYPFSLIVILIICIYLILNGIRFRIKGLREEKK